MTNLFTFQNQKSNFLFIFRSLLCVCVCDVLSQSCLQHLNQAANRPTNFFSSGCVCVCVWCPDWPKLKWTFLYFFRLVKQTRKSFCLGITQRRRRRRPLARFAMTLCFLIVCGYHCTFFLLFDWTKDGQGVLCAKDNTHTHTPASHLVSYPSIHAHEPNTHLSINQKTKKKSKIYQIKKDDTHTIDQWKR